MLGALDVQLVLGDVLVFLVQDRGLFSLGVTRLVLGGVHVFHQTAQLVLFLLAGVSGVSAEVFESGDFLEGVCFISGLSMEESSHPGVGVGHGVLQLEVVSEFLGALVGSPVGVQVGRGQFV